MLVLKIVEPGEVTGLSAVIAGEAYEITAETLGLCLVNFVDRDGLLRLMERGGELGLRSAQAMSREFQYAYREIHELVLAKSSSGKLARLLLSWVNLRDTDAVRELRIHAPVTHEEMAQRIGASRETVTRLLSEFEKERPDQTKVQRWSSKTGQRSRRWRCEELLCARLRPGPSSPGHFFLTRPFQIFRERSKTQHLNPTASINLQTKQLSQTLCLRPADGDFRLLFVIHAELV